MLSTYYVAIALSLPTLFAIALAIASYRYAKKCAQHARHCDEYLDSTANVQKLALEITELREAHESLLVAHRRLNSRVGMREARAKKKANAEESPSSTTPEDPIESSTSSGSEGLTAKDRLRLQAKRDGLLK